MKDENNRVVYGENLIESRIGIKDDSLESIPSPYLSGAMDNFFEDGSIPLIESNRGCPFGCIYCQQGAKYFSEIRFYSHNRLDDELNYIAKKISENDLKISIIEFADPNFGMYNEDTPIFKSIREIQDKYDYPKEIWCSTGKSREKLILNNISLLKDSSIMMRVAVQSLNKDTLKAIKRKNLKLEAIEEITKKNNSETYSDVMLGLPFESKESYIDGIMKLIDKNVVEFSMPQTILLKGTPMEGDEYIQNYDIKTKFRVIPECDGVYGNERVRVTENESIVISNSSLSFEDYIECRKINLLVMVFHNTRLLNCVYKIFDYLKIPRSRMLLMILEEIRQNQKLHKVFLKYLNDIQLELSDKIWKFDVNDSIEELISNKLYHYLAESYLKNGIELVDVIKKSLYKLVPLEFIEDIVKIIEIQIVSSLDDIPNNKYKIKSPVVRKVFNATFLEIYLESFLRDRIQLLRDSYSNEKELLNKIAYHLRPTGFVKKIKRGEYE